MQTLASAKIDVPWKEREFLTMQVASEIVGVSPATLYVYAKKGTLNLEKFLGRTVVRPYELMALLDKQTRPWSPSDRNRHAVAARERRASELWPDDEDTAA